MPVAIGEMMGGVRALEGVDLLDRQDVYLALRTTLVARYEEFPIFDRCFETFWRFQAREGQERPGLTGPPPPPVPEGPAGGRGAGAAQEAGWAALDGWEEQSED